MNTVTGSLVDVSHFEGNWNDACLAGMPRFLKWLAKEPFKIVGSICHSMDCPLHHYLLEVFDLWADVNDTQVGLYKFPPVQKAGEYEPYPDVIAIAPSWMLSAQKRIDRTGAFGAPITGGEVFSLVVEWA